MTKEYTPPLYEQYDHPSEIRDDASLTHTQKMSMLEAWAEDARARTKAASEGMTDKTGDTDILLKDIETVLLDIKPDAK